ncbi:MAG: L,D-transpeptidase family protein [Candidatus Omnitrophica bacterium]|nr:L,D-transpeptidase family protein [Candidatus Omnitrophota bacterium]
MKKQQIFIIIGVVVLVGVVVLLSRGSKTEKSASVRKSFSLKKADDQLAEGNLTDAKDMYKNALEKINDPKKFKDAQNKIEEINMQLLFSANVGEASTEYVVRPNDALSKIARKYGTTVGLIKRVNHLESDIIKPGQKLKVITSTFSVAVDKSQNLLFLKRDGEVIKTYIISTGKNNSTPIGTFKIVNKLSRPTWFKTGAVIPPDSPENILGSRWLGFDIKGYGIHGTTEPEMLGQQVTLGCVRMRNDEVEELYDIVPIGTEATVVD